MIVAIHQPQYLPWLGYFHKILSTDRFCLLDNVQYKKNEWQNRNRIKTAAGWQWLTVPVGYRYPQTINEVTVNNSLDWQKKHLHALQTNYSRTPFFEEVLSLLSDGFTRKWERLAELNIYFIEKISEYLGQPQERMVRASDLSLRDDPTDRLIDICRHMGADIYLSGPDGARYMDLTRFRDAGIRVMFQNFGHPLYPQQFAGFEGQMSIVDMLFNCGRRTVELIISANPTQSTQSPTTAGSGGYERAV